MTLSKRRWAFAIPGTLTAIVIFLSLGNPPQLTPNWFDFDGADKLKHAFAYATLGVVWLWAFRQNPTSPHPGWMQLWGALFALGALMEVLQWSFYPNRMFEFADMVANGTGALLGCLAFNRIFPHSKTL